jgi:hypothetical protein
MGTNFTYIRETNKCSHCHRFDKVERHIGKSSAGWVFFLHVYPEDKIFNLLDWVAEFVKPGSRIVDEYGKFHTPGRMFDIITQRVPNLQQSPLDGRCISHGAGTWECHVGPEESW